MSLLFQPLAKADDCFDSLPDDIIYMLLSKLAKIDYRDLHNLRLTKKRCRIIGTNLLTIARSDNTKTLMLKEQSTVLVDEASDLHKIKDIISFNSPAAFVYFLEKIPIDTLKDLWREETFLAATAAREPSYLSQIFQTKGKILSSFMRKKQEQALTKQELIRIAYSLLFSMIGFESAAWNASWEAAKNATWNATRTATWDAAWNAPWDAAWSAARNAAKNVSRNAAENAAWKEAWNAAWFAAENAAWSAARNAAEHAARNAVRAEISLRNFTTPQAIGRLSYRVAEKVSLLYFLKEAHRLLETSYQAAYKKFPVDSAKEQNIFSSEESWEAFKTTYFSHLSAAQLEFLNPWLLELDKIVSAIACASHTPSNADS